MIIKRLQILGFLAIITQNINADSFIKGRIDADSTWSPVVYLSIIPNFDQLYSMSNQMIIESSEMDETGRFSFKTDYLPSDNYIYRIHLSKKGDPPASLIIGGKDENHLFLIANNKCNLLIENQSAESLFGRVDINGFLPAKMLKEIDEMVLFVDTANFNSTTLKQEQMEKALDEKLRQFADTCSFPLVALYALYKSDFESNIAENPNFYSRFLDKWKDEKSPYFEEFSKNIPAENKNHNYSVLFGFIGLLLGSTLTFFILKRKPQKSEPAEILTIQERKIFLMIQSGKSNKEISNELNIEISTVKSHVNNLYSKLKINSRKEILNV
ncbi:MAG TPA: helix-turn-helix transcriptional regulator [Draconibacterium sp.]|nr:helix-turn-helix transcriptional regulator [Draconibacterium sp.]